MKKIGVLLACLALHSIVFAQADSIEQRKKLALEIIATQNAATDLPSLFKRIATIASDQTITVLRTKNTELSDAQLKRTRQVLEDVIANEMLAMLSQTLPKINEANLALLMLNFNTNEMLELHRFYLGPLGKKALRVTLQELPNMMSNIMPDATATGQKIAIALHKAYAQLDSEGIKLRK